MSVRLRAGRQCLFGLVFLVAAPFFAPPALSAPQGGVPLPWIFVGDSLTAGVQNAALLDRHEAMANGLGDLGQQNGYAGQLALQAGATLTFPRIRWPGFPNIITAVEPPFTIKQVTNPPFTLGRMNPHQQATNLAVSGATAEDALHERPNDTCVPRDVKTNPLSLNNTNCVLGAPGLLPINPNLDVARSQVEMAEHLTAGTIFVLLGTNEALGAAIKANPVFLTPVKQFQKNYAEVLRRLKAVSFTLVVSNIPDVTLIPFLTSREEVAERFGLGLLQVKRLLGIGPGDFVTPPAFSQIHAILANPQGPPSGPLSPDVVLTASEADTIRNTVDKYNNVIAKTAARHGAVLVDAHALNNRVAANGIVINGRRLTFDFGGGIFSLDGVHLTNTGYAIFANEYIKTLNARRSAGIPRIPLPLVARRDPLVDSFPGRGRPPAALEAITPDMVQSLERLMLFE